MSLDHWFLRGGFKLIPFHPQNLKPLSCRVKCRPSFSQWTCELCSQEMDCLTGNFTKYFKSINKFDLFLSFCRWKVLGISANLNFWCIFSCIKQQTSTKYHKKSGWHCCGSQEGKKKRCTIQGAGIRFDTEEVYVSKVSCWGSAFDYILDHLTTFLNYSGIVPTWWNI